MTNILVVNAGSSSLKYQLIDVDTENVIAKGICERIGDSHSNASYKRAGYAVELEQPLGNHAEAVALVLQLLTDPENGVVHSPSEIAAVGHRVVHGGERFAQSALIDDACIAAIEECIPLGPLHNPANLMGIAGCREMLPNTPMVAVFDTSWGQGMARAAYMYALPYEAYEKHGVRRYGFHGTSHAYVTQKCLEKLDVPAEGVKIVTCHLGNGSSVSCSVGGRCVDTSMGLTPLEGLPMGTRSGSIDPAIIPYLMERAQMSAAEIDAYMNKKSGMLGISGVGSDFRDLWKAANAGNDRARLALDMFCLSVKKLIGSYAAEMGGVDAIVFTAGVGENDQAVRDLILRGLEFLGCDMDYEKNLALPKGVEAELTRPNSRCRVFVIPTNEELAIARDTARIALA
ncbi:MAG: acetate kinase [Clostridiales bacterium]|nr:acetate kinase [Clostridiales bacterium]